MKRLAAIAAGFLAAGSATLAADADLEVLLSSASGTVSVRRNDLPGRFAELGIEPAGSTLIRIDHRDTASTGSAIARQQVSFLVIRADGTIDEQIAGPCAYGAMTRTPMLDRPLTVVINPDDGVPADRLLHPAIRAVECSALAGRPLRTLDSRWVSSVGRIISSKEGGHAFVAPDDAPTGMILRAKTDGTFDRLHEIHFGARAVDRYGEPIMELCVEALFAHGGDLVVTKGDGRETLLWRFRCRGDEVQEVVVGARAKGFCHVMAVSPNGDYIAVKCQGDRGLLIQRVEEFGTSAGERVVGDASVPEADFVAGVSDRIRVQAGASVSWWTLDDEVGSRQSRVIRLQTDVPGRVMSSACDGKFLVSEGRGWTVFREGRVFREFREAPRFVYVLDIGRTDYALLVQDDLDDRRTGSERQISVELIR